MSHVEIEAITIQEHQNQISINAFFISDEMQPLCCTLRFYLTKVQSMSVLVTNSLNDIACCHGWCWNWGKRWQQQDVDSCCRLTRTALCSLCLFGQHLVSRHEWVIKEPSDQRSKSVSSCIKNSTCSLNMISDLRGFGPPPNPTSAPGHRTVPARPPTAELARSWKTNFEVILRCRNGFMVLLGNGWFVWMTG